MLILYCIVQMIYVIKPQNTRCPGELFCIIGGSPVTPHILVEVYTMHNAQYCILNNLGA